MKFKILAIALISVILFACSANKSLTLTSSKETWDKAETFYNKGKFEKAIPFYEQLILERNSQFTADAQLKLAECFYNIEKYADAVFEYEELIRLFPENKNVNTAQYMIGMSYFKMSLNPHYSQEETDKSLDAFQTFIDKYPWDNRRSDAYDFMQKCQKKKIEKNYLAGYIYYKTQDYSAALLYFDEIVALGNHDTVELKSLYYSALIYYDRKDRDNLFNTQEKIRENFPDSKELKKVIKYTLALDKKLNKK